MSRRGRNGVAREDLPLFSVVGLRRIRGGGSGGVVLSRMLAQPGRPLLLTVQVQSAHFVAVDGSSITVTSHRTDSEDSFEQVRSHAPINPYLQIMNARGTPVTDWNPSALAESFEWHPVTVEVNGTPTAFELCQVDTEMWVAVGRVPPVILDLHSSGVPISSLSLKQITGDFYPPPPPPDLGDRGTQVLADLDQRFQKVPFQRVRRLGDYWALLGIEDDHVDKVAGRIGLSEGHRLVLRRYWLERIDVELGDKLERFYARHSMARMKAHRSRAYRFFNSGLMFNITGPGARTWFGNRYATLRPYTFRLRWRP